MITQYANALRWAHGQATWRLRRVERAARRHQGPRPRPMLHRWAAVRAELHNRGVALPDPSDRRRWAR